MLFYQHVYEEKSMLRKGTKVYTAFSEYIVDKQISQGGNGTVFLVHDQNKNYALKAIDRDKTSTEKLKRFKNEISFCEDNTHPNIIKVLSQCLILTDIKYIFLKINLKNGI